MQIPNEVLLPRDILFVADKGLIGKAIKIGQVGFKDLNSETFVPTHVGLIISNSGLLIESTQGDGVDVDGIHKYIENDEYEDKILIRRNIEFEKVIRFNLQLQDHYSTIFTENWREKYNYGVIFKIEIEGRKFCSELAFHCLKRASVIKSEIEASKVFPYKLLDIIANDSEWRTIDAAAMLSLSRKKINLFFDEKVKEQQSNIDEMKKTIDSLEHKVKFKEEMNNLTNIPNEIKDRLNIIADFSSLIPMLKKVEANLLE